MPKIEIPSYTIREILTNYLEDTPMGEVLDKADEAIEANLRKFNPRKVQSDLTQRGWAIRTSGLLSRVESNAHLLVIFADPEDKELHRLLIHDLSMSNNAGVTPYSKDPLFFAPANYLKKEYGIEADLFIR